MFLKKNVVHVVSLLLVGLALTACGSGGGGGGGGGGGNVDPGTDPGDSGAPPASEADLEVKSSATTSRLGGSGRVDLMGGPANPAPPPGAVSVLDLAKLMTTSGVDLNADGVLDTYATGLSPGNIAARILGANNLYDLFQTTTGRPVLFNPTAVPATIGGPPFTGGDANFDGINDGGPGLFSNVDPTNPSAVFPGLTRLPVLPNTMGDLTPGGSGRGPSPTDQHQFLQIEFPYNINRDSLFDFLNTSNSFLGDSQSGVANVFIERRWVSRPDSSDGTNIIDHTFEHAHVPGVAIIGGVAAVPFEAGFATLTTIDLSQSNLPDGAKARAMLPNVFTYIAHESPSAITQTSDAMALGRILPDGVLVLPSPTDPGGLGGRVFGANAAVPSSVNDFATDGDELSNPIGFIHFRITRLRAQGGTTIANPYFHSFPVSQANVGLDPLAILGSYNRGPAIEVDPITRIPAIGVLDPSKHIIGPFNPIPATDAVNVVSTRALFRVDFDKEVVPNSVGFSRRHTIHTVPGQGIVFPFNGNTRPIQSPSTLFVPGLLGAPLAPSIYLAVNQRATTAVNNPLRKNANIDPTLTDDGVGLVGDPNLLATNPGAINGLFPPQQNTLATLPRGVVPCDIYPLNQNNLQSYVVQPLVELPPGSIVTLGVCMPGLGMSNNALPPLLFPPTPTNYGNFTRSGTMFTPWQGLTPVGIGDPTLTQKQAIIANATIVKVNAGAMDLEGNLFFGGTTTALDWLIDANTGNDLTDGGFNVARTFRIGTDATKPYVNAPVAPQAVVVGFGPKGLGVVDLAGNGFTTNAPGGGLLNAGLQNSLIVSRRLSIFQTGLPTLNNWSLNGSVVGGDHVRAFGIMGRYASGGCSNCMTPSFESELAVGAAIPTGALTPAPGVNEGSSGFETMVRDSFGSQFLTSAAEVSLVRDIMHGDFLDTVFFDTANPFATAASHRTYNTPLVEDVPNNTIAEPPTPNPPPLRFPVGLPHTVVRFDQADLTRAPFLIEGNEAFTNDSFMRFDDGTGVISFTTTPNGFISLNPTTNTSNPNEFDVPHLPNAGFPTPFVGELNAISKFIQTGPMAKTSTAGALILAGLNSIFIGSADSSGLVPPFFQSRQQIGNFLFVTDGVNKKLHAVNSNTMKVIRSLDLPDPYGMGLTVDLDLLFVSNEGDNSVSVVASDPRDPATFMTELARIDVGEGPRAVAVAPDNEDVFVLNRIGNTISIISVGNKAVRRTITQSGINRPNDIAMGMREVTGGPAFQSGTYHGFISNGGGDNVLVYESGPSGQAGIGFDNVIGTVTAGPVQIGNPIFVEMDDPRGLTFDPDAQTDSFAGTIGCYVAHRHPDTGQAMVTRIAYTKDSLPGQQIFNSINVSPSFGEKVFEIKQQYVSAFTGIAHDVVISDHNRQRYRTSNFGASPQLLNAGAGHKDIQGLELPRNAKYPLSDLPLGPGGLSGLNMPRWDPDRLYLAIQGGIIDVFDIADGTHEKTIFTAGEPTVLSTYFEQ